VLKIFWQQPIMSVVKGVLMKIRRYLIGVGFLVACSLPGMITVVQAHETQERAIVTPTSPEEARQQEAVFAFLRAYYSTLAKGEVTKLSTYHPSLTPAHLEILRDYFAHTIRDLHITLEQVRVSVVADTATVWFYRTDRFVDRPTNRPVKKSIYLSTTLVRGVNGWHLTGLDQVAFALGSGRAHAG
jgi:hypothetical protein